MAKSKEFQLDSLTGLIARTEFSTLMTQAIAQTGNQPLALAMLDIDHFLLINKQYGHDSGNEVLKKMADNIVSTLGEGDLAIRFGGDEFAIIYAHTEREQALLSLESLRQRFEREEISLKNGSSLKFSISAGVAAYPIDGTNEAELVRKADQALYRAKLLGRNRIRLAYEEKMSPKTSHYTITQLERLSKLSQKEGVGEAELLREALDDLLRKYEVNRIES